MSFPIMYEENMAMPFTGIGKGADGHTPSTREQYKPQPYASPLIPKYEGRLSPLTALQSLYCLQGNYKTIDSLLNSNGSAPYNANLKIRYDNALLNLINYKPKDYTL